MEKIRCAWCEKDDLYRAYHDQEWGKPVYDDKTLFEFWFWRVSRQDCPGTRY